ncbi:MAG: hypothetical protein ACRBBW_18300 [Cellvibrionaceae bacterium]
MNTTEWKCKEQLTIAEWGEDDAVVYLSDCGDLHLIAGVAKSIISALKLQPMSSQALGLLVNTGSLDNIELDAINRQIVQLNSLGLLVEAE